MIGVLETRKFQILNSKLLNSNILDELFIVDLLKNEASNREKFSFYFFFFEESSPALFIVECHDSIKRIISIFIIYFEFSKVQISNFKFQIVTFTVSHLRV